MPPTRTIPPAKAMKTERTHEENQERAYIAASRRSDRSLEARVESARRASEIHKRRTGRSLRVTEQDVINEEMYEEEDDDLPLQYRRLTAHLQTGSTDFNRRLAAYLTNQVAMRSAVGQMVNNPYAQPFPNQFQQNMFQSPMLSHPQMPVSPGGTFRPGPYPSPHHPGFRQNHGRAYSTILPGKVGTPPTPNSGGSMDHRRMSTPVMQPPHLETEGMRPDQDYMRQTQSAMASGQFPSMWQTTSPFTTSLPFESQQMLAGTLDTSDPVNALLMHGAQDFMSNPYYPWGDAQNGVKGMPVHPSAYPGMAATLAPSALEVKHESAVGTPSTLATPTIDGAMSQVDSGNNASLTPNSKGDDGYQNLHSGQITPGEGFWDSFVQDGSWHEDSQSS